MFLSRLFSLYYPLGRYRGAAFRCFALLSQALDITFSNPFNPNHTTPQPMKNDTATAKAAQDHAAAFRAELDALLRKYGAEMYRETYRADTPDDVHIVVDFALAEGRDWIEIDLGRYVDGKPSAPIDERK